MKCQLLSGVNVCNMLLGPIVAVVTAVVQNVVVTATSAKSVQV